MTDGPAIASLVLAAGESSRMRRDKALLPYRGRTFVETIVAKLREAGIARIAVVLGHHADEIRQAVSLPGVEVLTNRDYMRGQTSSLQKGLAAFEASRPGTEPEAINAVLLCLVDHPAFEPSTVSVLIEAFARTGAPIIIPALGGRRGHPVLIAARSSRPCSPFARTKGRTP
jgi:nicotine blue oxidoreductase